MTLQYDALMGMEPIVTTHRYSERDTMLYALGVGVGSDDPFSAEALRYAYEDGLQSLPTMAVVLAYPGPWIADPRFGIDYTQLLHGEQFLRVRSEEHTSELQSLMRISYAVFCLKKKK